MQCGGRNRFDESRIEGLPLLFGSTIKRFFKLPRAQAHRGGDGRDALDFEKAHDIKYVGIGIAFNLELHTKTVVIGFVDFED